MHHNCKQFVHYLTRATASLRAPYALYLYPAHAPPGSAGGRWDPNGAGTPVKTPSTCPNLGGRAHATRLDAWSAVHLGGDTLRDADGADPPRLRHEDVHGAALAAGDPILDDELRHLRRPALAARHAHMCAHARGRQR